MDWTQTCDFSFLEPADGLLLHVDLRVVAAASQGRPDDEEETNGNELQHFYFFFGENLFFCFVGDKK